MNLVASVRGRLKKYSTLVGGERKTDQLYASRTLADCSGFVAGTKRQTLLIIAVL